MAVVPPQTPRGTKQGRDDYLAWLRVIKERPGTWLLPGSISVGTLYVIDRTWAAAREDVPRVDIVRHLANLRGTGSCFAMDKDISFEDALDELIKLVEGADVE